MRIISFKVSPIASVFGILYAAVSPIIVVFLLMSGADRLRIPLGLFAPPLTYLNINFDIQRPTHFLTGALFMVFAAACYAVTGWLTGAAAVMCFNFIARRTGGVQASVLVGESAPEPASTRSA
jgi:hypothetical protein